MAHTLHNRRLNPPASSIRKLLAFFCLSVALLVVGITIQAIDPIQIIADFQTKIEEGSMIYGMLAANLPGVYVKTYMFNVTNSERFLSGKDDKLKVEEIGPFTYQEIRIQKDLVLNKEDGTMTYSPKTLTKFMPEMSMADPKDVTVIMPNIAMLSMSSMISTHPYFTRMGYNFLTTQLKSKSIVKMSAYDYLWGYQETLITLGNRFLPGWISFGKMGILDRMYDNTVDYRINLGATHNDRFDIKSMNGYKKLRPWENPDKNENEKCNTFQNAYEGIGYPSRFTPGKEVRIYRNVLCRFLELDYRGTKTMDEGSVGLVYKISNRTFQMNHETECLCRKGNCVEGMSDISPCFYQLPLTLSAAHFTGADPNLYNKKVEGLHPDEERHDSVFIIEPRIGMVLETSFSVQVNILVKDVKFNPQSSMFADMVVPVAYFNIVQPPLGERERGTLHMMYQVGPPTFMAITICLILVSLGLFSYWTRLIYWNWLRTQGQGMAFQQPEDDKSKASLITEMTVITS